MKHTTYTHLDDTPDWAQPCECFDPGCVWHAGHSECDAPAVTVLYRIDMQDDSGVAFCEDCAQDALESGLFTDESQEWERWDEQRQYEARLSFAGLWR